MKLFIVKNVVQVIICNADNATTNVSQINLKFISIYCRLCYRRNLFCLRDIICALVIDSISIITVKT